MPMTSVKVMWQGVGMLLLSLLLPCANANHLEARIIGVSTWDAECSANTLTYWEDMVRMWYDEMPRHGWYHQAGSTVNDNLDSSKLCDPDIPTPGAATGCLDYKYVDHADAAMIFMHGFDAGEVWGGVLRRNTGPGASCRVTFPDHSYNGDMRMGDVDLEFLHMSSSDSLDKDNLAYTWRVFQDPADSPSNGRRLHQLTGFHGFMWIGGCCDDQYEDFSSDAHTVPIRDAWMDNMYVTGINGNKNQCPVAYAVGTDLADCFARIDHERYNNAYSDPSSIGYYCYYYYAGCDPEGKGSF